MFSLRLDAYQSLVVVPKELLKLSSSKADQEREAVELDTKCRDQVAELHSLREKLQTSHGLYQQDFARDKRGTDIDRE